MNHFEVVRASIIKLVPEVMTRSCSVCEKEYASGWVIPQGYCTCGTFLGGLQTKERPIRLADVILSIRRRMDQGKRVTQMWLPEDKFGRVAVEWNPLNDDLSKQGEKCINYIHSLICI